MGNAVWLLFALPQWYLSSIIVPFSAGPLTLLPAAGVLCLAFGVVNGLMRRQRRLLLFFIPFMITEALVAIAGALRGQVQGSAGGAFLIAFIAAQLLLSIYLARNSGGTQGPAYPLAFFSTTYAIFGAFVAGMSFSDTWL